jgi:hypothetical protein
MNKLDICLIILFLIIIIVIIILNTCNIHKKENFIDIDFGKIANNFVSEEIESENKIHMKPTQEICKGEYNDISEENREYQVPTPSIRNSDARMKYYDDNIGDDIIESDNYICRKKTKNELLADKIEKREKLKRQSCPNKSLNRLHKKGPLQMKPNQTCSQISYEFDNTDYSGMRPIDYYKNIYNNLSVKYDDERFKGFNYGTGDDYDNPRNVGRISLVRTNMFPVGVNYVEKK